MLLLLFTVPEVFLVGGVCCSVERFTLLPLWLELLPLFTVPVVFLAGGVCRSDERVSPLLLFVPELRAGCPSVLVGLVTVPLLRPLSRVVLFVFDSTPEFLFEGVVVLPELTVPLTVLDLLAALAGLAFVPEFLLTSGRYTLTERLPTLALPALPELVTFLTDTLLPVERSTSCALGPL